MTENESLTTIAISPIVKQKLEMIKRENRKKTLNEVIGLLLSEHDYIKETKQIAELPKESEEIKCINRILHNGAYWCVYKPPRMIKLPTLDICVVCKKRKIGLPSTIENFQITQNEPQKAVNEFLLMIPEDVEKLIIVEDNGDYFKVKMKRWLERKEFQRVNAVMRSFDAEYYTPQGDKPYFKIIKKRRNENETK